MPASRPTPLPPIDMQTGPEKDETQVTQLASPTRMESLIEKAKEDLAQRLSINISKISLLEAREVVWPDASLGCPQPDVDYVQVEVEGVLIRLGVNKERYFYHSSRTDDPFLCERTSQVLPRFTPKPDEFVPPPDSEID